MAVSHLGGGVGRRVEPEGFRDGPVESLLVVFDGEEVVGVLVILYQ